MLPSFSPLSKLIGPTKRNVHGSLLTIGSTSAVLMADTSDLAQLLMDDHRIEDFQHNLFQKITLTIRDSRRMQGYGVKCQFPFAFS